MAPTPRLQAAWILPLAAALASGCVVTHPAPQPQARNEVHAGDAKGGPPPWAPAHGYRRKHGAEPARDAGSDDVHIVFDSQRGVHVVLGLSDHYWDAGRYYRVVRGEWRVSARIDGPWVSVEVGDVPLALVRAATSKDVYPARRAD
jgi:hypothetical protein